MGKANNALWQKKNKMKHPYDERTSCRTSETYKHPLIIQTHRLVIIIMEKSIWHMIREKFQLFWVIFFSSVFFSGDSGRNEQWWIGNWYIHYEFICPCSFCMYIAVARVIWINNCTEIVQCVFCMENYLSFLVVVVIVVAGFAIFRLFEYHKSF